MVKKNWEMPELMELGLKSTKEDCSTLKTGEKCFMNHTCQYCGKEFKAGSFSHIEYELHVAKCGKPGYPLPGPGEGVPTPTVS